MLGIPAIRATVMVWEGMLQTLKRHVGGTHDGLTHVVEAVDHVPMVIIGYLMAGSQAGVRLHDGEEAVQLVRH